jgi:hypothetical protein
MVALIFVRYVVSDPLLQAFTSTKIRNLEKYIMPKRDLDPILDPESQIEESMAPWPLILQIGHEPFNVLVC